MLNKIKESSLNLQFDVCLIADCISVFVVDILPQYSSIENNHCISSKIYDAL